MGVKNIFKRDAKRFTLDDLASQLGEAFQYGGTGYVTTTLGSPTEELGGSYVDLVQGAYRANGIVFACALARACLFTEVRFQYRDRSKGRPGSLYGDRSLALLERPWPNASTGDLLARAIQDVDLAGNFYAVRKGDNLFRLRPDWVKIAIEGGYDYDATIAGYQYAPLDGTGRVENFLPEQIVHWMPIPDPAFRFRGMSWLTPVIREVMSDFAMTSHKQAFFDNGATVNLAVKNVPGKNADEFKQWVNGFKTGHEGQGNAHKTLFLSQGADVTVIGSDLKSIDFKQVQGAGELRIAGASGVPALIVGVSSDVNATYANYAQARRKFADHTMRPLWRSFCAAVEPVLALIDGQELWYDDREVAFLQEDVKDAADIRVANAAAANQLVTAGFKPDTIVIYLDTDDVTVLKHSGLPSVQLQPLALPTLPPKIGNGSKAPPTAA
jgi:HK97 family phage portal protein